MSQEEPERYKAETKGKLGSRIRADEPRPANLTLPTYPAVRGGHLGVSKCQSETHEDSEEAEERGKREESKKARRGRAGEGLGREDREKE